MKLRYTQAFVLTLALAMAPSLAQAELLRGDKAKALTDAVKP